MDKFLYRKGILNLQFYNIKPIIVLKSFINSDMTLLWKFKNIYYNQLVALYFIFKHSLLTYQTHIIIFIYQACLLFNAIQVVAPPSLPTQLQGQDGLNCVKVRNNGNAKQYFCEESECSICSIDKVPQKHIVWDMSFIKYFYSSMSV